jgi:hypothetical protein
VRRPTGRSAPPTSEAKSESAPSHNKLAPGCDSIIFLQLCYIWFPSSIEQLVDSLSRHLEIHSLLELEARARARLSAE